jgi:hypothetical protein
MTRTRDEKLREYEPPTDQLVVMLGGAPSMPLEVGGSPDCRVTNTGHANWSHAAERIAYPVEPVWRSAEILAEPAGSWAARR